MTRKFLCYFDKNPVKYKIDDVILDNKNKLRVCERCMILMKQAYNISDLAIHSYDNNTKKYSSVFKGVKDRA